MKLSVPKVLILPPPIPPFFLPFSPSYLIVYVGQIEVIGYKLSEISDTPERWFKHNGIWFDGTEERTERFEILSLLSLFPTSPFSPFFPSSPSSFSSPVLLPPAFLSSASVLNINIE